MVSPMSPCLFTYSMRIPSARRWQHSISLVLLLSPRWRHIWGTSKVTAGMSGGRFTVVCDQIEGPQNDCGGISPFAIFLAYQYHSALLIEDFKSTPAKFHSQSELYILCHRSLHFRMDHLFTTYFMRW